LSAFYTTTSWIADNLCWNCTNTNSY